MAEFKSKEIQKQGSRNIEFIVGPNDDLNIIHDYENELSSNKEIKKAIKKLLQEWSDKEENSWDIENVQAAITIQDCITDLKDLLDNFKTT